MSQPWTVLAGIAVIAILFVLVPVAGAAFSRFRGSRRVTCPEGEVGAEVGLDARRAAWTALFGEPDPRIRSCSLWPRRSGCAQECLRRLA